MNGAGPDPELVRAEEAGLRLYIVSRNSPILYESFREEFLGSRGDRVVLDRRVLERRSLEARCEEERRRSDRRRWKPIDRDLASAAC